MLKMNDDWCKEYEAWCKKHTTPIEDDYEIDQDVIDAVSQFTTNYYEVLDSDVDAINISMFVRHKIDSDTEGSDE